MGKASAATQPPAALAWPAAIAGILILISFLVTIERVPLPWNDEIFDASAVLSLVRGGTGVPTALPPGTWQPFPRVYGPAYFRMAAILASTTGVTPVSVRL